MSGASGVPTSRLGNVVNLLADEKDEWWPRIWADEDELAEELKYHARPQEIATLIRTIAHGVGAQFEALHKLGNPERDLRREPPSQQETELQRETDCRDWQLKLEATGKKLVGDAHLKGRVVPDWWTYWIVVLDPAEGGATPFDEEEALRQPGRSLKGKTIWYRLIPATSSTRGHHALDHIFLANDALLTPSSSGPTLRPSNNSHLPSNNSDANLSLHPAMQVRLGHTAGFYCMNTAFIASEGREQSMWRWYWGSSAEGKAEDFGQRFPGPMVVSKHSAQVIWRGAVKPTHPVPRDGPHGGLLGVLNRSLKRKKSGLNPQQ